MVSSLNEDLVKRLEAVVLKQEQLIARQEALQNGAGGAGGSGGSGQGGQSKYAKKYADMVGDRLTKLKEMAGGLGDEELTSCVTQFCNAVVINGSFIVAHAKFHHEMIGTDEQFCTPLMSMGGVLPNAGNWDIHPRGKHVNVKKAIQDGFGIFTWSRLRHREAFAEDINMKDYLNGISFNGNKVRTSGTDAEKALYEAYNTLCSDIHTFFLESDDAIFQWKGTEDIDDLGAWLELMTQASSLNDFSAVLSATVSGGSSGTSGGSAPSQAPSAGAGTGDELAKLLDPKIAALEKATEAIGNATVSKIVAFQVAQFRLQPQLLRAMAKFKKPADLAFVAAPIQQNFEGFSNDLFKDRAVDKHVSQALQDNMSIVCWINAMSGEQIKDFLEQTLDTLKCSTDNCLVSGKQANVAWGGAFYEVSSTLGSFILQRRDTILNWTGKEDGAGAQAFITAGATTQAAPASQPKEEVKKAAEPAKAPVAKAAAAKKPAAKKPASKAKFMNKWNIDYFDGEDVVLEEDECGRNVAALIFSVANCTIDIKSKVQNVNISNSKNVKLVIHDAVVTYVECASCENLTIDARGPLKMINADRCKKLEVIVNERSRGCKVQSIGTKDIGMTANRIHKSDFIDKKFENNETIRFPVTEIYQIGFAEGDDKLVYEAMENME